MEGPDARLSGFIYQHRFQAILPEVDYLKGPKLEIFGSRVFTQIRPGWIGDLETRPKNSTNLWLGVKIAILYFLALSPTSLKKSPIKI